MVAVAKRKREQTGYGQKLRAIREAKPYPIPLDEVLHGMSVFDAIVEAARSDTIVAVAG